jgi:hypothetical protein
MQAEGIPMKDQNADTPSDRTMVSVRLSKAEQEALRAAAEKRGENVSAFSRRVLLTEAGVRRSEATTHSAPTRSATIGTSVKLTDSGTFVSTALLPPTADALFGSMSSSASKPAGDFSQPALRGIQEFTSRHEGAK